MTRTLKKDVLLRIIRDPAPEIRKKLAGILFQAVEAGDLGRADQRFATAIFSIAVDDPDPDVRKNLARIMCASPKAPREVVTTLACSSEDIALPVLKFSPLLDEGDLANLVRGGSELCQCVIAARKNITPRVSSVIAKYGAGKACAVLARNRHVRLQTRDMMRLIKRFGRNSIISDALIERGMLPAVVSRQVMSNVSETLRKLMIEKNWTSARRAQSVTMGALENGTLDLSLRVSQEDLKILVDSLMADGQLTPTLVLRSVCAGYIRFAETSISLMAKLPRRRVSAMMRGAGGFGLRALYAKAGLPLQAFALFKVAIVTYQDLLKESGDELDPAFHRRMIERVLTCYRDISEDESGQLLRMLEHFASDMCSNENEYAGPSFNKAA